MSNETIFIDFGWSVGKLSMAIAALQLLTPDESSGEGVYVPAKSITIFGDHNLKRLRDALNKAYPPNPEAMKDE